MYKFETNNDLNTLKKYMLYSVNKFFIDSFNNTNNSNLENDNNNTNNIVKVSKFLSNPNYNKFKSKYYETENYKQNYDKLFWCYYKIINNYEDEDIEI